MPQPDGSPWPSENQGGNLSDTQKVWGAIGLIFLVVLFPPFLIVVLIWGIVKLATRR